MISAYENNMLGKEYEPYFAWKKVREQLDTLDEHAQLEDKLLSYLEVIENELSRIAMC